MDAKDEIKEKLGVEEVIGEYLELKRSGRNFKALSPFSGEKTASFMVSPEKGIWHDFSSNQGGDIFSFVMLMEGIDFVEAMKLLAPKAGVDLSQFQRGSSKTAERKKRIQQALKLASQYYQRVLIKDKKALEYVVNKRKYGQDVIRDFCIGYSPSDGQSLFRALSQKGFTQQELKDAGLISGSRDMFRNRIMVPLHDGQGLVIGFTARVLDDSLPKYINTPQTLVYDKSRHVFGLHLAKDAIRKQGFAVLVEGNMDVIASHKANVKNVVATAGTAMTMYHLKQLNRLTEDIRLAFDQDDAGIRATERAIPIAQEVGVRLSIIDIVGGKDPDDLIKEDPGLWNKSIENSKYVMDWLIDKYASILDLTTAEGKREFTSKTLKTLASVNDLVEREHYVNHIAKLVEVDSRIVSAKLKSLVEPDKPKKKINPAARKNLNSNEGAKKSAYQDLLLGLNLLYPESVRDSLKHIEPRFFTGDNRQLVAKYLFTTSDPKFNDIPQELQQIEEYVKIVLFKTEELYESWAGTDLLIESAGMARRLAQDYATKRKQELSREIQNAEVSGDDQKRDELLQEFNTLIKQG